METARSAAEAAYNEEIARKKEAARQPAQERPDSETLSPSPTFEEAQAAFNAVAPDRLNNVVGMVREQERLGTEAGTVIGVSAQERAAAFFYEEESRAEAETGQNILQHLPADKHDRLYFAAIADRTAEHDITPTPFALDATGEMQEVTEDAGRKARRAIESLGTEQGTYRYQGRLIETQEDLHRLLTELTSPSAKQEKVAAAFEAFPTGIQYALKAMEAERERIEHVALQSEQLSSRDADTLPDLVTERLQTSVAERAPLPLIDRTGEHLRVNLETRKEKERKGAAQTEKAVTIDEQEWWREFNRSREEATDQQATPSKRTPSKGLTSHEAKPASAQQQTKPEGTQVEMIPELESAMPKYAETRRIKLENEEVSPTEKRRRRGIWPFNRS